MPELTVEDLPSEQAQAELQQALQERIRSKAEQAGRYGHHFAQLWLFVAEHAAGGKLLRPRLFIDAVDALGNDVREETQVLSELGVGIELLHYAFLLHDDVIDGDFQRRQGANLLGAARDTHPVPGSDHARRWGAAAGLLAGDLLIAEVHQIFARLRTAERTRLGLLDLLDHTIQESVCGEQADVGLSLGVMDPTVAATLSMTQCKTATYSFEFPLLAAAAVTGAGTQTEAGLAAAARHMGTVYQLQDDLLTAFGDADEHGKDPRSDFREGKLTPLIAYARTTPQWPQIAAELQLAGPSEPTYATLRALLADCGALGFVQNLLSEHLAALEDLLTDASGLPPRMRRALALHTESMRERKR